MSNIIPKPSLNEVKKYLKKWDSLDNYVSQEKSLKKLFKKTYPENKDLDDILIKVCSLNDFYSTHLFNPFAVAKKILSIKIDKRLKEGDLTLVNEISKIKLGKDEKEYNFYSFASKYCSHHNNSDYPIFDSYVYKMLLYFRKKDKFSKFKNEELKNYIKFKEILLEFRTFYSLERFSLKELDKYLWLAGKDYFKKTNKKG
jgi:hypothetical protein